MRFVQRSRVGRSNRGNSCPTINVGMALHHTAFPGTISLRPSTMIQVVRDYVTCLTRAGFIKFSLLMVGGNITSKLLSGDIPHLADLNISHAHLVQCQVGNSCVLLSLAQELYGNRRFRTRRLVRWLSLACLSRVHHRQRLLPDTKSTG